MAPQRRKVTRRRMRISLSLSQRLLPHSLVCCGSRACMLAPTLTKPPSPYTRAIILQVTGTIAQPACPGMCAGVQADGSLALASCSDASATGFEQVGGGSRGRYVSPND